MHALHAVAHVEGDGGQIGETGRGGREVLLPLVHRVQVVRGARNVLVAEPLRGEALVGVVREAVPVGHQLVGEVVGVDRLRIRPVAGLHDVRGGKERVVVGQARVRNTVRIGERRTLGGQGLDVRVLVLRLGGRVPEDVVVAVVLHHHDDNVVRLGNRSGSRDDRRPDIRSRRGRGNRARKGDACQQGRGHHASDAWAQYAHAGASLLGRQHTGRHRDQDHRKCKRWCFCCAFASIHGSQHRR
jgi:hypothetical protein